MVPADRKPEAIFAVAEASAGRILVPEWGDAAKRLAVALHRWDRLTLPLSDDEFDQLGDIWRDRLQPHERAAVMRRLAA